MLSSIAVGREQVHAQLFEMFMQTLSTLAASCLRNALGFCHQLLLRDAIEGSHRPADSKPSDEHLHIFRSLLPIHFD